MKNPASRLILLLATASLFTAARAAGPTSPMAAATSTLEHAVKQQINRHVIYPLSDPDGRMYGQVDVAFAVDVEGRLVVLAANSSNKALCDYVVNRLRRVKVGANRSGIWYTSHIRFVFRPEPAAMRK